MRAQESEIPHAELQLLLAELDDACKRFAYEDVRTVLLKAVKEYTPQCGIEDLIWSERNKARALRG
ncbi:hypothetical protein D3C81_1861410 [compost metagenome]